MHHWKPLALAAVLLGLALTAAFVDLPGPEVLRDWVRARGAWAPVGFLVLGTVGTAAFFPKPVLAAAAGLLFGIVPGMVVAVLGFTGGAMVSFAIARLAGRRSVARWLDAGWLAVVDVTFARSGLAATIVLRFLPVVPFAVSNYAAGVTAAAPASFAAGTLLGLVPPTTLAATVGDAALDLGSPRAIAAVIAWLALATVGVWWGGRLLRRAQLATTIRGPDRDTVEPPTGGHS